MSPQAVVTRLGLPLGDPIRVRVADGRRARRKSAEMVYVQRLNRHGTFTTICEPKRETTLIGAIVLEDFDFLVDCVAQRVVPRNPTGATYEIEWLAKFAERDPVKARLVELRYFAGLTGEEAAEILGISARTADRYWVYARAWLRREMEGGNPNQKT